MSKVEEELPDGWTKVLLNQLASHHSGDSKIIKGKLPSQPAAGLLPAYSASGQDVWRDKFAHEGDAIIISAVGARCGKCFKASGKWTAVANTHVVWPHPEIIDRDFLWYKINDENFWVKGGSAQPFVKTRESFKCELALPPLNEQQRIVDKIETLFTQLDKGEEAVREVQKLLGRYRQSVLKSAVTGQLTADWRAARNGQLEHGRDLLARARKNRRESWSSKSRYNEPKSPEVDELPRLPQGWVWADLESLSAAHKHALKAGPFGSSLKKSDYSKGGYKIFGQEQVIAGDWTIGDYFIGDAKFSELENCRVAPKDVLISLVGTIGKVLILPDDVVDGIINPRLVKISLNREVYLPEFFKLYFESGFLKAIYSLDAHGATMDILNLGIIKGLPYVLCSLEEQREVVARVEDLFSKIDILQQQCETELKRSASLRQSILKDAFAGRLVPQDPDDESASELLTRIAERQDA